MGSFSGNFWMVFLNLFTALLCDYEVDPTATFAVVKITAKF